MPVSSRDHISTSCHSMSELSSTIQHQTSSRTIKHSNISFTMIKQLLPFVALLPGLLNAAVIPFTLDGALDAVTADSSEYNTGGKISVNGVSIVIPKNLQFQFPAAWVGLKEIAAGQFAGNEVVVSPSDPSGESILLTCSRLPVTTSMVSLSPVKSRSHSSPSRQTAA